MPSKFIHVIAKWQNSLLFYDCVVLHVYTHHIIFIHSLLMDTYVASMCWQLRLGTLESMYVYKFVFLFFSDIHQRVELLDHVSVLFLIFEKLPYCFP